MKLISKYNKELQFSLCVIDIYNKRTWLVPLKDWKDTTITNVFQNFLDKLKRKPNKVLVDKSSEIMKSLLQDNNIEIHSTPSEEKSDVD